MYDATDFVKRLLADPRDSLLFGDDDRWSYPVPVPFPGEGKGLERFATSRMVRSDMRKLFQPSHSRFYAVVVEVFCDLPGLPRASSHTDIEVGFVMRRIDTVLTGTRRNVRRLARNLLVELAVAQGPTPGKPSQTKLGALDVDADEIITVDVALHHKFEQEQLDLLAKVGARTEEQFWTPGPVGGRWTATATPHDLADGEQQFPMWRLPPRPDDCAAARTRSTWFGLVPTYSADAQVDGAPKLDDHGIYQLRCVVRRPPPRGHEHCPARTWTSDPTLPFRLAAPYDPEGTKNHRVSITMPDLRALAARATRPLGAGAVRIATPPGSQLLCDSNNGTPTAPKPPGGGNGSVCFFAFELFFIVSFFVFLLFLPVVVLLFQLWWMLALRFCIPPSVSFALLAKFFAEGHVFADLTKPEFAAEKAALDTTLNEQLGRADGATTVAAQAPFAAQSELLADLTGVHDPPPDPPTAPELEPTPVDPLCR